MAQKIPVLCGISDHGQSSFNRRAFDHQRIARGVVCRRRVNTAGGGGETSGKEKAGNIVTRWQGRKKTPDPTGLAFGVAEQNA
jgi:hypothetical protein